MPGALRGPRRQRPGTGAHAIRRLFIANRVLGLDPTRATPAVLRNDGLDYVPTNKHVLFGHHFAAIAGAGPLVALAETTWNF